MIDELKRDESSSKDSDSGMNGVILTRTLLQNSKPGKSKSWWENAITIADRTETIIDKSRFRVEI